MHPPLQKGLQSGQGCVNGGAFVLKAGPAASAISWLPTLCSLARGRACEARQRNTGGFRGQSPNTSATLDLDAPVPVSYATPRSRKGCGAGSARQFVIIC